MIRSKLFQKYFLIALICLIGFLFVGFRLHFILIEQFTQKPLAPAMNPPLFIAKMIDHLSPDKIKAIQQFEEFQPNRNEKNLILIDQAGKVLFPKDFQLPFDWNKISKPVNTYDFTEIADSMDRLAQPPFSENLFAPRPRPPFEKKFFVVKLSGQEPLYLLILPPKMHPNGAPMPKPPSPWIGILSLFISLGLGIAVAIALINFSISKKVREADQVITDLKNGNLNARFKITRNDEFGKAMLRFNLMAEEIQKLVDNLRQVESARTKLIQELAHDLRTPIASLKNLQETLKYKNDILDSSTKAELQDLSLQEIEYFQRLVEDLLFLAQVSEPKYRAHKSELNVIEILKEEYEAIEDRYKHLSANKISFTFTVAGEFKLVTDAQLLRRLFRNALENAASFAKTQVNIECQKANQGFTIAIRDDGGGFSAESLAHFGERKFSRKIDHHNNNRISLGLGSVVMKTITETFGAKLVACNRKNDEGTILGAELKIVFETAQN